MNLFNKELKFKTFLLIILLTIILIFIILVANKSNKILAANLEKKAESEKGLKVKVIKVRKSTSEKEISLNGETKPSQSVTIYTKISGFLKKIYVDKGDYVSKGKILATIESPVIDEAYLGALSNFKNKNLIAKRALELRKENLVSEQEKDQAVSDAEIAKAQLNTQKILKDYEIIKAPFSGTITARYADIGALVQNAENSQNTALPIVTLSNIEKLIVTIFIDQLNAPFVKKGTKVIIETADSIKIEGFISRVTDNLDPKTKMMLAEIDITNENKKILSGSFVKVLIFTKTQVNYILPVECLIIQNDKKFIASIDEKSKAKFKEINVTSNDGKNIFFTGEISEDEYFILTPTINLKEGNQVQPLIQY
ncbi:efflux RND transporter periplasmic adaptor subunit [Pigmentibacter sp. JX0631]|uniref:efflux RND transporter periplasmic adaptor subunit n=1 Tax=Pigmentibacter sp. JX0631 TaxID=2976982 RepID=UPI002468A177|nr:efflux RND transporter periplasmic adaptor subunit [Pigmentibacter sp. JX0631]WGL60432.1 efflux RND transporter periplasmic adaptor subunit [Pigmentibacter sp. JX0631]